MAGKDFLGTGLGFPFNLDQGRGIGLSYHPSDVEQSIRVILSTRPGERMKRPTFGCRLQEMVFRPNNSHTHQSIKDAIMEAVVQWEPRVRDLTVHVRSDPKDVDRLNIEIEYLLRDSNTPRNLVYPFYLQG